MNAAEEKMRKRLEAAGLRPTRQRISLGEILFGRGDRHVSAEALHAEAAAAGETVSLATVYNTLRAFTGAGLVRELTIDANRVYFDTNIGAHHHFFDERNGALTDIPAELIKIDGVPTPPEGAEIEAIDVIVRVKTATS